MLIKPKLCQLEKLEITRKKVLENNMKIKLENTVLEIVSKIKYLGIIINKNLNFETAHVNYLGKKIRSKLATFCRISMNLTLYMRLYIKW